MSIKTNTWLEESKLPVGHVLFLVYMWCQEQPPGFAEMQSRKDQSTVTNWYQFSRDICRDVILRTGDGEIGGL